MNRIIAGLTAALLAGFAALQVPAAKAATSETVLYSFSYPVEFPVTGLVDVKGILYGTTTKAHGYLFAFDTATGNMTVVHTFGGKAGSFPASALLNVNGILYGTSAISGCSFSGHTCGSVFSFDPANGRYKTLHTFTGPDGADPEGDLVVANGTLYGTTENGGANRFGTAFSVDLKTGTETVLHSFQSTDGEFPVGGLLNVNGVLYGTASAGGSGGDGEVFSLDPSTGKFRVLHAFAGDDGAEPGSGLIDVNGILYGMTEQGGNGGCDFSSTCGTVFSLDPATGVESVLYAFKGGSDGELPQANDLLNVNGVLYGTTTYGGAHGVGTVFRLTLTGAEKVLYSFGANANDGVEPEAGLIRHQGVLYGTTLTGGGTSGGGTIYSIKQ